MLLHRPLRQGPGHGVKELGHGEDVSGVAQGAVKGYPQGLAVLVEAGDHPLHVPFDLKALLSEGLTNVVVSAHGDAVVIKAWPEQILYRLARTL